MPVRLRLARVGLTRNSPQYTLVAVPSSSRTTARPLEVLGRYDPKPRLEPPVSKSPTGQLRDERVWGARQHAPKTGRERAGHKMVEWNVERVKYWLSQGAQPSDSVEKLLVKAKILGASVTVIDNLSSCLIELTLRYLLRLASNSLPKPNAGLPVSRERRLRDAVRSMSQ